MELSELNSTLKDVFDMAVFSQLLEMDEEEDRKNSSTALYSFIEKSEEQVDAIEYYL
jgi:osomolarity two-component system phosphorelay intermediate protein YPD1